MTYTQIVIREAHRIEATNWARASFGHPRGNADNFRHAHLIWYSQQLKVGAGFYFRNPEHATLFAMRWS